MKQGFVPNNTELAHLTSPTSGCRVTFTISLLKAFHYIWHFQSWQDKSEGRAKGCLMMQVLRHSWIFKKKYTKQLPDSKRAVSGMGNFYIRPHPDREVLITKFRVCLGGSHNGFVAMTLFSVLLKCILYFTRKQDRVLTSKFYIIALKDPVLQSSKKLRDVSASLKEKI